MKRVDGIAVVVLALLYGWGGWGIEKSQVGIQDRVGPGFFPLGVAVLLFLCGVIMIVRQDGVDHRGVWPPRRFWKPFALLVSVFILYGVFIESMGFFIVTTLLCTYLAMFLQSRFIPSLISGSVISLVVFLLFNVLLEIHLPSVLFSFIENWFYGY